MTDAAQFWEMLAACPPLSLYWAGLGYRAGVCEGRMDVLTAIGHAGHDMARSAAPLPSPPSWDELQSRRTPDYEPCPVKCGRCSRCICALGYAERGGPFLGLDAERGTTS